MYTYIKCRIISCVQQNVTDLLQETVTFLQKTFKIPPNEIIHCPSDIYKTLIDVLFLTIRPPVQKAEELTARFMVAFASCAKNARVVGESTCDHHQRVL